MEGAQFVSRSGETKDIAYLKSKDYVGLYFSAHWCPPCKMCELLCSGLFHCSSGARRFTPRLAKWYNQQSSKHNMEIVFCSSDRNDEGFREYLGEMPWVALPRGDSRKDELSKRYGVQGIPTLVFVDKQGETITEDGRAGVEGDPEGFPWPPKPVEKLSQALSAINDVATLVFFSDMLTDGDAADSITEAMNTVANEFFKNGKPSNEIRFALADEDDENTDRVREFLNLTKDRPSNTGWRIVYVNIPEGKKAFLETSTAPDADALRSFIGDVQSGAAASVSIRA